MTQGRKMNIDLDSWEAGYADGQYGRPPQCAIGLDQVSYLSGFYRPHLIGDDRGGSCAPFKRSEEGWALSARLPTPCATMAEAAQI